MISITESGTECPPEGAWWREANPKNFESSLRTRVTHRAARLPLDKLAGGGAVDNPAFCLSDRKAQNDISFRSPKQECTSFDGAGD